jgi:hypothetical protein
MSKDMTASEMGRKGGLARAKKLTKKERIAIAKLAGSAPKRKRIKNKDLMCCLRL